MSIEIASPVTCKICRKVFVKPPGAIIRPGAGTNGRLAEFARSLAEHFIKKHGRENGSVELQGMQFIAMLRLICFEIKDAELKQQHDFLRWQVHQATLAGRLKDEMLEQRAAELAQNFVTLALSESDRETATSNIKTRLIEVFKGYRDIVEEPGRYTSDGRLAAQIQAN